MFKDSLIILKKELRRMFTDKRLLFMLVVLPLVMLPLIYSFMGKANRARHSEISTYVSKIAVCTQPGGVVTEQLFFEAIEGLNADIEIHDISELSLLKQKVTDLDLEAIVVFPENMDQMIAENIDFNMSIYYNSTGDYSEFAFAQVQAVFGIVSEAIVEQRIAAGGLPENTLTVFLINDETSVEEFDLAEDGSVMGKLIGMMMPFFIVIYLFANSMKVGLDSVAGEKERGTLAILLVNQVDRLSIVLGKMISVMIAAIVGAVSSAIGLKFASRSLLNMYGESGSSLSEYSMGYTAILQFALIVIPLAILISSLVIIISTFARNVKEGQGMVMPVYIAVMVMGVTTMQIGDVPPFWMRIAPIFNSLVVLKDIFSHSATWTNMLTASVSSLIVSAIFIFVTLRMFNNEKVLFRI